MIKNLEVKHILEEQLQLKSTIIRNFSRLVEEITMFDFNGKIKSLDLRVLKSSLSSYEYIYSSFFKLKNFYVSKYQNILYDTQEYNGVISNEKIDAKKNILFIN